jgi:hypothetical protein
MELSIATVVSHLPSGENALSMTACGARRQTSRIAEY